MLSQPIADWSSFLISEEPQLDVRTLSQRRPAPIRSSRASHSSLPVFQHQPLTYDHKPALLSWPVIDATKLDTAFSLHSTPELVDSPFDTEWTPSVDGHDFDLFSPTSDQSGSSGMSTPIQHEFFTLSAAQSSYASPLSTPSPATHDSFPLHFGQAFTSGHGYAAYAARTPRSWPEASIGRHGLPYAATGPIRTPHAVRRSSAPASVRRPKFAHAIAPAPSPTLGFPSRSGSPVSLEPARRDGRRTVVEATLKCATCDHDLAQLVIRGSPEELMSHAFSAQFQCAACVGLSQIKLPDAVAIRRRQSTIVGSTIPHPDLIVCEVCSQVRGHGHIYATSAHATDGDDAEPTFTAEITCAPCYDSYRRCSDCGGGSAGKWRCRELFGPERKTCSLDHARSVPASEIEISVGQVSDFADSVDQAHDSIVQRCEGLLKNATLSNLAIPDFLESDSTLLSTYQDVEAFAAYTWAGLQPAFHSDSEAKDHTRRYLALRWTRPRARKARNNSKTDDIVISSSQCSSASPWSRPGKQITGFATFEWDKFVGGIHIASITPWLSAESLDTSSLLIEAIVEQVKEDSAFEPILPPVQFVWTSVFYPVGHRVVTHMTKKRGFQLLDDYLAVYDTPPEVFPPYRPDCLGRQQQLGWTILVKRIDVRTPPLSPKSKPKIRHVQSATF